MKHLKITQSVCAAALLAGFSMSATATQTPVFTTFGALPAATFGGSGIPNGAVAQTPFSTGGLLALNATQRFGSPVVTNNGAGRYFATAGAFPANTQNLALWNFNFYIDSTDANGQGFAYQLFMDVDPTTAENFKSFGPSNGTGAGWTANVAQNSWNLGFDTFEGGLGYAFNPLTPGEYTFVLTVSENNSEFARTSIVVQVNQAVPEPGSLALMGLALAGLAAVRRKQKS